MGIPIRSDPAEYLPGRNNLMKLVYELCVHDIMNSLIEGYSGTIMCYGQTGAGKTFTCSGSFTDYKYRGLIPRAINQVFSDIQALYDQQIIVRVSYLEIYNESMFDLLSPAMITDAQHNLAI